MLSYVIILNANAPEHMYSTTKKKPNREHVYAWMQNGYGTDKEQEQECMWNGDRIQSVKHSLLGFFRLALYVHPWHLFPPNLRLVVHLLDEWKDSS